MTQIFEHYHRFKEVLGWFDIFNFTVVIIALCSFFITLFFILFLWLLDRKKKCSRGKGEFQSVFFSIYMEANNVFSCASLPLCIFYVG